MLRQRGGKGLFGLLLLGRRIRQIARKGRDMTGAQRDHFLRVMSARHGKAEAKRFVRATDRRFPLGDLIEYRKLGVVVVQEGDLVNIYAWGGDSGNWYQLGV